MRFAGETDIGKTHDHNEDTLYLPTEFPLGIVADGMGGHASGEVASKLAVEAISRFYEQTASEFFHVWPIRLDALTSSLLRMKSAIAYANHTVYTEGEADPAKKGMGTTVVSIYFEDDYAVVAHVGDSRLYRVREGRLELIMEDHSFVNDMARMRGISREEAVSQGSAKTNVVSRVMGPSPQVAIDATIIYPELGDLYLLCSDGLNDMISDEDILRICLETQDVNELPEKLIAAANEAGGEDNITALVVRVEEY